MPLDISELNRIEKQSRAEFQGGFNGAPSSYQLFTSEIVDTEAITPFEWIGSLPRVREWVGARHVADLENYDYSIKKKDWEMTIKIPYSKTWDSSKTALSAFMKNRTAQLGAQFRKDYPSDIIIQALEDGTTNLAFDGLPYFSDARDNDNLMSGSGITVENLITDITTARSTMKRFTDESGRRLGIIGNLAIIPPELEIAFLEICGSQLRDGTTNNFVGALEYVVDARLSDTSDWYFVATNEFIKPILFVSVGGVNVAVKDNTFDDRSVLVGADATGNVGYSFPELAIKVVNS